MTKTSAGGPGGTNYLNRTHERTVFNGNVSTSWQRMSFTLKDINYSSWSKSGDSSHTTDD